MKLIGITGGVGMGKSTAQSMLVARAVPVLDTDAVARELVEPGQPALEEIAAEFGAEVLAADGSLRRDVLAKRVFSDADARSRLESILHPRIRVRWEGEAEHWRRAGRALGAVVIPLLYETSSEAAFDDIVCIACSPGVQAHRLKQRGWSSEEIQARIAAQLPISKKMASCDHVIWTDGELRIHERQWDQLLAQIQG